MAAAAGVAAVLLAGCGSGPSPEARRLCAAVGPASTAARMGAAVASAQSTGDTALDADVARLAAAVRAGLAGRVAQARRAVDFRCQDIGAAPPLPPPFNRGFTGTTA